VLSVMHAHCAVYVRIWTARWLAYRETTTVYHSDNFTPTCRRPPCQLQLFISQIWGYWRTVAM